MAIIRVRDADQDLVRRNDNFTGAVWGAPMLSPSHGVAMSTVYFSPGSRTHWHSHEHGQVLTIVSGAGIVASRDEVIHVGAGGVVWTEPGVEHWHGADESSFMVHTTLSIGATEWRSAVVDDEYEQASRVS